MDNNFYDDDFLINNSITGNGIPYDNIIWQDVPGNPFGTAGNFNAVIFGDANNIVDMKGAFAVGGSFYSPRGLSLNFGNNPQLPEYTPDNVGFLVGGNITMNGSLVVIGHVVVNGRFRAASGSTFLIGKDGNSDQIDELKYLYEANGQSQYWTPSDRGSHYIISSYDTPHYLPANRIDADVSGFFQDARESVENYKECIEELPVNGSVEEDFHEWVLIGDDPELNVFVLDRRPNGLINKGIRFDVPDTSTIVVRLQTGINAHLQYGLLGSEAQASKTIYVFEDATNIYMEVPAAIWGSFLAPGAMLHGHQTGGHITGNVALNSFAVSANSGFEFHLPVFDGLVFCNNISDLIDKRPIPVESEPIMEEPLPVQPAPVVPEPIIEEPLPVQPTPITPEPIFPTPMPARPRQERPIPALPNGRSQPVRPEPSRPTPVIPAKPTPMPIERPRPEPIPCPECPKCPEPEPCPECPECLIEEGIISGCIWGCKCCKNHGWIVELYDVCNDKKALIDCVEMGFYGSFEFCLPFEGCYTLKVIPTSYKNKQKGFYRKSSQCKPIISLNNVGVSNFYM